MVPYKNPRILWKNPLHISTWCDPRATFHCHFNDNCREAWRRSTGRNRDDEIEIWVSAQAQTAIRFSHRYRDRDSRMHIIPSRQKFVKCYIIIYFPFFATFSTESPPFLHRFSTASSEFSGAIHKLSTGFRQGYPQSFPHFGQKNSCLTTVFFRCFYQLCTICLPVHALFPQHRGLLLS